MANARAIWPVTVTSSTNTIKWEAPVGTVRTTTITAGDYYVSGSGVTGVGNDLLITIANAMAAVDLDDWSIVLRTPRDGFVQITNLTRNFTLLFADAANTIEAHIGFNATNRTNIGAGVYTVSNKQHQSGWYPEVPAEMDSGHYPGKDVRSKMAESGARRTHTRGSYSYRDVDFEFLPPEKMWATPLNNPGAINEDAETGLWARLAAGDDIYWYPDVDALADADRKRYVNREQEWATALKPKRVSHGLEQYSWSLRLQEYVS